MGRAVETGILDVHLVDLRDFSDDPHRKVDDEPYGGGPGMVLTAPPVFAAVEALRSEAGAPPHVVFLSPQGRRFDARLRPGARRAAARRARLRPLRGDRRADACRGPFRRGDLSRGLRPFRRRSRGARDPRGRVSLSPGRGPGRRERVGGQLRGRAARPSALQPPALVPRTRRAGGALLRPPRGNPAVAARAAAPGHAREAPGPPPRRRRSTTRKGHSWRDLRESGVRLRIAPHG